MLVKEHPWKHIITLLREDKTDELTAYMDALSSKEIVHSLGHLSRKDQMKLLTLLSPEDAAEVMEDLPEAQAAEIIEEMETEDAAAILNEMQSDDQTDLILELDEEDAAAILAEMLPEYAADVRRLMEHAPDTAGGLMITEFLAFEETLTIEMVISRLREHAHEFEEYHLKYIYVNSVRGKFVGVLQVLDLLMAPPDTPLSAIVIRNVLSVSKDATLDDLINFFDTHDFYGVPVVDKENQLTGVVLRKAVLEEQSERTALEHLETQGIVGGDELRTMPVLLRSRRRLSWLSVNILLNIIAASVIAYHQDVLSSVIALAVFLPIISDMSGCSGNQAVAVSMRELSLGVVRPGEALRVWRQEVSVGMINGSVLGLLIALAAWLWKGNIYLGIVAGGALAINTVAAVSIGGTVPLLLKKFGVDPALASGPILTTITDMLGFFLALTFASMALAQLGGI
jgi:magnesium transporter